MAKTKRRRRSGIAVRRAAPIVIAAPRRSSPARRRAAPVRRVARRGASSGGGVTHRALKGALIGGAIGLAEREGHLARVPNILQLGAVGSLGVIAWGLRRFGGVNMPLLDDVAIASATITGNKFGREGLSGARVQGEDDGVAGEFDVADGF